MAATWTWDETLYAGSAPHYVTGRLPYPSQLPARIAETLHLDGSQRLLDVGCGPGSFTLALVPFVGPAIGIDADAEMIEQARRSDAPNVTWRRMRGEQLPGELGEVDLITFAQSFHWMDRPRVAALARGMLSADGALVHVGATTHRGTDDGGGALPFPRPPHEQITALVASYLGPRRRAGRAQLYGGPRTGEDDIYRAAGFTGRRVEVACGDVLARSVDDVVAATFSLSSATPHLFGDRRAQFEAELRGLLDDAADDGRFSERLGDMAFAVWRP